MSGDPGTREALGARFADAFARQDFDALGALLHPEVDFRAVTPSRSWESAGPERVVEDVLRRWLAPEDEIEELVRCETDSFADRSRVGYRLRGRNPTAGEFVIEQQAYIAERDGLICWMRVTCSGFRPTNGG